MKNILILFSFISILAFPYAGYGQLPDWYMKLKQVELLVSSKSDVESIFKSPRITNRFVDGGIESVEYATPHGRMNVSYSGGQCLRNYDYAVEKGKVINIIFLLKAPYTELSKFNADKKELNERYEHGAILYLDEDTGIDYGTQKGKVRFVQLIPSTKDDGRRCKVN